MTGQQLKDAILQQAMQGKLVPQNPDDEPASELLARVRAEKQRLVEIGEIRSEKSLAPIIPEDTPFEIPDNWVWCRIGECVALYNGNSINAENKRLYSQKCKGLSFIATKDVGYDHTIDYENGIYIPESNNSFKIAYKSSILLCMEGGSAGRKIGFLERDVNFGNKLCCYRPIVILPLFLYYYLQSPFHFFEFKKNINGIIGGVGTGKLRSLMIPLPPLEEQKRIVAKIEELLPLAEAYEKEVETLNQAESSFPELLKQSILQDAIQGKLVPQNPDDEPASELLKRVRAEKQRLVDKGEIRNERALAPILPEEIPFELPDNWVWVRLGDICDVIMGQSPAGDSVVKHKPGLEFHQGKIYFGSRIIQHSPFVATLPTKIAPENSVLLCVRAPVGKVNIADRKLCIGRGLTAIVPVRGIHLLFIYYYLITQELSFNRKATGSTFKAMTVSIVKNQLFPLPPLAEQNRIVAKIEELLPLCSQLQEHIM